MSGSEIASDVMGEGDRKKSTRANGRLFAVSEPFFGQITRRKPTSDPLPPSGSGKDKILYTEAVGLVMIDYGDAVVGGLGKCDEGTSRASPPGVDGKMADR